MIKNSKFIIPLAAVVVFLSAAGLYQSQRAQNEISAKNTLAATITNATLTVDANQPIAPFKNNMRGLGYANWEHSWGKPYIGDVVNLTDITKEIRPGVIRYAGGLWANKIGWERAPQRIPCATETASCSWSKNGNMYFYSYGTTEIDSLAKFAAATGADVMMQVDIVRNDPAMWADLVKYTNVDHNYNFKYWELGNELDLENSMSPAEYATRVKAYQTAMNAVLGPNNAPIVILAGVPAFAVPETGTLTALSQFLTVSAPAARAAGKELGGLSFHWYQQCNADTIDKITAYQAYSSGTTPWPTNHAYNRYSRRFAEILPARIRAEALNGYPTVEMGVTELNADACKFDSHFNDNHIGALWFTDVLGRMAYNGVSYSTAYLGYGQTGYGLVHHDGNGGNLTLSSSYYAYLMYSKYFGDYMVKSSTSDNFLSVWASTDSKDAGKLKIMVTNLTGTAATAQLNISNFVPSSGKTYTMTAQSSISPSQTEPTLNVMSKINGKVLDTTDIATSIASIPVVNLGAVSNSMSYSFPAYSTTAIVLTSSTVITPPPGGGSVMPTATSTPIPTATVRPTATLTPLPTSITSSTAPSPTKLPTSTPTHIPTPTFTVKPTSTPLPTATPRPTATPVLSLTPSATPTPALPPVSGFSLNSDVGNVHIAGTGSVANNQITITGAGDDIWNYSDAFHYMGNKITGNATVIVRIKSLVGVNEWTKAGIMFRESLAPNSRNAYLAITPLHGIAMQTRKQTGAITNSRVVGSRLKAPMYLKLVRSGNTFISYYSANGIRWSKVQSVTVNLPATVYVGLAVTSHDVTKATSSLIDSYAVGQ